MVPIVLVPAKLAQSIQYDLPKSNTKPNKWHQKVECKYLLSYTRPGISSLKGQGHFNFSTGHFHWNMLKYMGNTWIGTKANTRSNRDHGLHVNPGLFTMHICGHPLYSPHPNPNPNSNPNPSELASQRLPISTESLSLTHPGVWLHPTEPGWKLLE